MDFVLLLAYRFITVYLLCIFVWALLSWLPQISPGLAYNEWVRKARDFLDTIVLPFVRLFRFIKPVQVGAMLLDLSSMAAIVTLIILQSIIAGLI